MVEKRVIKGKVEKKFLMGNEAIAWGAMLAGCRYFFGYPITPQNEIGELFARELPRLGGVFVQVEAEMASIAALYGAATTGVRAMTSTSSPGWALMQEGISCATVAELPMVIAHVQRGGPGQGSISHSQMDYFSVTRGGGHGGYKTIVLAPTYTQEMCDLAQLAFHLADKYLTPVILLSDGLLGRVTETIELRPLEFGPLPPKDWAVGGTASRESGVPRRIASARGQGMVRLPDGSSMPFTDFAEHLSEKWQKIMDNEVRYTTYQVDDADMLLVSYGSSGRACRDAVDLGRAKGFKLGLLRPITLWPFPHKAIHTFAQKGGKKFVAVEDSMTGLIEDVKLAVEGKGEVHRVGLTIRDMRIAMGTINPDRIFSEIEQWL